jgi:hypothetical protein
MVIAEDRRAFDAAFRDLSLELKGRVLYQEPLHQIEASPLKEKAETFEYHTKE